MSNWILLSLWLSRSVLVLLLVLSVWSVTLMIDRRRVFAALKREKRLGEIKRWIHAGDRAALQEYASQSGELKAGLLAEAMRFNTPEGVDRSVKGYISERRAGLEKGLNGLATLGSNAPFIGLFGTVMGVIQAFGELATQQQGTQAVMAAIAEALIATALGLFVAIPAVVAYNTFAKRLRETLAECETLRDAYVAQLKG